MRNAIIVLLLALKANAADRPSAPPLLSVPPAMQVPAAGPRGPSGEYESGYFYLPDRAPEGNRKPPRRFSRILPLPTTPLFPDRPRLLFR